MKDFDLKKFTDEEVISLYPKILKELKNRDIIRTNNLVGDLGGIGVLKNITKFQVYQNYKMLQRALKILMLLVLMGKDMLSNQLQDRGQEFLQVFQQITIQNLFLNI